MIFINHFGSGQAAKDYHRHLSKGDAPEYFAKDESLTPKYEGKTAEMLGIAGMEADQKSFGRLCDNEHPVTGEKLTARTKEERRAMTDVTFDCPKAVSLAGLVDGRVHKAMNEAVDETIRDMEANMAVRVRKGGSDTDRLSGNALYVKWWHDTGRPLEDKTVDPQRHCHVTFLNVSYDAKEKTYKACQWGNIVRDKAWFQSAYHARLGAKLTALGYGVEKDGTSFKLTGIDKALCEKFSRRTAVIEEEVQTRGITDPAKKAKLGRMTRNKKGNELGSSALKDEWLVRMTPDERASLDRAGTGIYKTPKIAAQESLEYAKAHTFERQSTISERRLKAIALQHGVGSVLPDKVDAVVAKDRDLIRAKRDGQDMVTTHQVLRDEIAMLKFAREGHGTCNPLGVNEKHLKGLSDEQHGVALHVLNSRDRVVGIRGGAGTGKTKTVTSIVRSIEASGGKVFAFAQSSSASRGTLRQEGLANADTLETLFRSEHLQRQVKGQTLLVDESGLNSTRDMGKLFEVAKQQQARVILVGDYYQHGSVQAGDAFRLLEKEAGVRYAELKEVRRQKVGEYRKAVEAISKGPKGAQKGFDMLDKMGCVIEASGDERHKLLVKDYLEAVNEKRSALIIAPTHAEGERLTGELREALKGQLQLTGKEREYVTRKATNWTDAQKTDARNYEPGMIAEWHQNSQGGFRKGEVGIVKGVVAGKVEIMRQNGANAALPLDQVERFQVYRAAKTGIAKGERVRLTKNGWLKDEKGKKVRVNNGDIFTVEGFTKDGDMKVDGKILPKTYGHIAHGYVDTSYASQGKTVDRVYIAAGSASVLAVNSQQWYVSVSRGREEAKVYVDSKGDIRQAITRSGQRLAAVELVKGTEQKQTRLSHRLKETLERNRVVRYWREQADKIADRWRKQERGVRYGG